MKEERELEFLTERARELLDRQIDSYRSNHAKAGTIIGASAIFIPIFLFIIEKSPIIIQLLSAIPIILFLVAIIMMFIVLHSKKLDQGFNQNQFTKLVNWKYKRILLYEIGAKTSSITDNQKITFRQNRIFNRGLIITIIAIILSIILLFSNSIIKQPETMDKKTKQTTETTKDKELDVKKTKANEIPIVPKEERMILNEGAELKDIKNRKSLHD
jgi:hypothetical protein